MCQVEVWGVLIINVKVGVVVLMANCWVFGLDKVLKVELPGELWGTISFSYMCGFMGMEVQNTGFNGLSWTRKMEHG
jgi:hypothetical protein